MAYSSVNHTSIIFGEPQDNTLAHDEQVIQRNKIGTWIRYRTAFWFVGKSSKRIYVKYPMETERIKLTHKLINGKFNIYYNPKYENDIIIKQEGEIIKIGSNLELTDINM